MEVSLVDELLKIESFNNSQALIRSTFELQYSTLLTTMRYSSYYVHNGEIKAYLKNFINTYNELCKEFNLIRKEAYEGYLAEKSIEEFEKEPSIENFKSNSLLRRALLKENFEMLKLVELYNSNEKETFCLLKSCLETSNDKVKNYVTKNIQKITGVDNEVLSQKQIDYVIVDQKLNEELRNLNTEQVVA